MSDRAFYFGLATFVVAALAVAEYLGYITSTVLDGWSYVDLGVVAVLLAIVAIGLSDRDGSRGNFRGGFA